MPFFNQDKMYRVMQSHYKTFPGTQGESLSNIIKTLILSFDRRKRAPEVFFSSSTKQNSANLIVHCHFFKIRLHVSMVTFRFKRYQFCRLVFTYRYDTTHRRQRLIKREHGENTENSLSELPGLISRFFQTCPRSNDNLVSMFDIFAISQTNQCLIWQVLCVRIVCVCTVCAYSLCIVRAYSACVLCVRIVRA